MPDTPNADPAAAAQLLFQIGTGHMAAAALQTVLRLGVPDQLVEGPKQITALASACGAHEDALYRVLRALASLGLFDEPQPGVYGLTAAGRLLATGPMSFAPMGLWITSPFHFRTYAEMLHAVTTGQPAAEKVAGMPVFDYLSRTPDLQAIFNNAMTAFSADVIPAVLEVYDFSDIGVLVDVAGGHGMLLSSVLQRYPAMHGILFDLPHVVAGAKTVIDAAGVGSRLRTESGDFFQGVPSGGDAYIMKHIIHDWDDARARTILGHIRTALAGRPNGRVILVESIIRPGTAPDLGKIIDLEMLMMPGGRERTEAEFRSLFAEAGFTLTRVLPTRAPLGVVEARPAA